jgi:glutamate dehydrogenase/leucine dehydrogenase
MRVCGRKCCSSRLIAGECLVCERMSQGRKNALAGLYHGGAKGVIARTGTKFDDVTFRQTLFREYGQFITSLNGAWSPRCDVL